MGTAPLRQGVKLVDLLTRPNIDLTIMSQAVAPVERVARIVARPERGGDRVGRSKNQVQWLHQARAVDG